MKRIVILALFLAGCTAPAPVTKTPVLPPSPSGLVVRSGPKAAVARTVAAAGHNTIVCGTNLCICNWFVSTNAGVRTFNVDVCNVPCGMMLMLLWSDNPADLTNTALKPPSNFAAATGPVKVGRVWMLKATMRTVQTLSGTTFCSGGGSWEMLPGWQFFRAGVMPM